MKCHYIYDKEVGKVLIPGCWNVVISNEMSRCSCRSYPETNAQFERQEYNKKVNEQKAYIKELESEVFRLNRIFKKIHHSNMENKI